MSVRYSFLLEGTEKKLTITDFSDKTPILQLAKNFENFLKSKKTMIFAAEDNSSAVILRSSDVRGIEITNLDPDNINSDVDETTTQIIDDNPNKTIPTIVLPDDNEEEIIEIIEKPTESLIDNGFQEIEGIPIEVLNAVDGITEPPRPTKIKRSAPPKETENQPRILNVTPVNRGRVIEDDDAPSIYRSE